MARIEIVKFKCDVCGEEFEHEKNLASVSVPCYTGEYGEMLSDTKVELCSKCNKKLHNVIYENFAHIYDYYGLQVEKVFEDNEEEEND